ncbi:hypothetical protein ABI011_14840, partial [Enterococcus faecium]|uniref:hypothetical protein n=1 Tax=Enterococcus faecium TaxID=1352 RepID=UPI003F43E132
DFEKKDGQVSANKLAEGQKDNPKQEQEKKTVVLKQEEMKQLENLKSNILTSVDKDPALADLKNRLLMDVVSEGLRIQLIDNKNQPMFA